MTRPSTTSRRSGVSERLRGARPPFLLRHWARPRFTRESAPFVAILLLLPTLPLDELLLGNRVILEAFALIAGPGVGVQGWVLALLWVVVWTGNSVLLSLHWRQLGGACRNGVDVLRVMLASVPLLALFLRSLVAHGRSAGRSVRGEPGAQERRRYPRSRPRKPFAGAYLLVALNLGAFVLLMVTVVWLVYPQELSPERRLAAVVLSGLLHLGAGGFVVFGASLRYRGVEWSTLRVVIGIALILPLRASFPALLLLLLLWHDPRQVGTLAWTAGSYAGAPRQLPVWSRAQQQLSRRWEELSWWRRSLAPRGERRSGRLTSLRELRVASAARVWILLGFFEALLLAYWVTPVVDDADNLASALLVELLLGMLALLLAVGLAREAWAIGRWLLSLLRLVPPVASPEAWFTLAAPLVVSTGLALGWVLRTAAPGAVGRVVLVTGALAAVLGAVRLTLGDHGPSGERPGNGPLRDPLLAWCGVFLVVPTVVGAALAVGGDAAELAVDLLVALGIAAVLVHPVLGAAWLPGVLPPAGRGALPFPRRPIRARLVRGLVRWSALVPLGCLAVPLWWQTGRTAPGVRSRRWGRVERPVPTVGLPEGEPR